MEDRSEAWPRAVWAMAALSGFSRGSIRLRTIPLISTESALCPASTRGRLRLGCVWPHPDDRRRADRRDAMKRVSVGIADSLRPR
jgi:hypothetical protein